MNAKKILRVSLRIAMVALVAGGIYFFRGPIGEWFAPAWHALRPSAEAQAPDSGGHAGLAQQAPAAEKPATSGERRILYWVDPMHPAYKSDRPGIAPDCGMQLEPVYADEVEKLAKMPPGTVRITLERQQSIGVKLGRAEMRPVRKTIRAVAKLAYDETRIVHYHNKVEGWIEKLYVDYVGAPVEHGQPVLDLYSPELLAAQQEYLIARKAKQQFADSADPELARSAEELYEAAYQKLRLWDVSEEQIRELERTGQPRRTVTFYTEHGGVVLEKKAFEHMRVTRDTDLFMIADLSHVWAIADVYEYEAPLVRVGQKAKVSPSYLSGQMFPGEINYIYPQLDPQTRTLKVRIDIPNPDLKLRPEMFANVELQIELGTQLVVPEGAVLDSGNRQYVFVATGDGYFEPRDVTLGVRSDGMIAVVAGLKPGEQIVTSGTFLIDSESRLKAATSQMGMPGMPASGGGPHKH